MVQCLNLLGDSNDNVSLFVRLCRVVAGLTRLAAVMPFVWLEANFCQSCESVCGTIVCFTQELSQLSKQWHNSMNANACFQD